MVSTYAQAEQDMNAVERVLVYSQLPPEGDFTTPDDPPPSWPERGEIKFVNVEMSYRKGLPIVLKDVSFQINAGEKVRLAAMIRYSFAHKSNMNSDRDCGTYGCRYEIVKSYIVRNVC